MGCSKKGLMQCLQELDAQRLIISHAKASYALQIFVFVHSLVLS